MRSCYFSLRVNTVKMEESEERGGEGRRVKESGGEGRRVKELIYPYLKLSRGREFN